MFTLVLFGLSFSSYWDDLLTGNEIPIAVDYLIDAGFTSAMVLWVWMLGNFFKGGGPKRGRVVVGFSMLFLNLLSAPIYWVIYYVRQNKL